MRIKTGDTGDVSRIDVGQTLAARESSNASGSDSVSTTGAPTGDSIALSSRGNILQQAVAAGAEARANRIQQLKNQIDANRYSVDATEVSRALIDAHLAGD